ncbi:MAG: c-type cytochrome [Pseudomonadota bacterium]
MNVFRTCLYAATFVLGWTVTSASAADLKAGQALHDANCLKCHDSAVYTREDRRVGSLAGLRKQVIRCEQSLGLTWFDDQIDDVVHYLNATYYKFQ